jgi:hypothetical protein
MPRCRSGKLDSTLVPFHDFFLSQQLTNQVLGGLRVCVVLGQVVEEQLHIRAEVGVRRIRRGRQEAENLHLSVVPKVQIEVEASDGDGGDGLAGLGDGPDAAIATEPLQVLATRDVFPYMHSATTLYQANICPQWRKGSPYQIMSS